MMFYLQSPLDVSFQEKKRLDDDSAKRTFTIKEIITVVLRCFPFSGGREAIAERARPVDVWFSPLSLSYIFISLAIVYLACV
jgi:hypothetical protein